MMHRTTFELEDGLSAIRLAPSDHGVLSLIVRRPAIDQRDVVEVGQLDLALGLIGDSWSVRPSSRTKNGCPHPDMQLNVMNARAIALIARDPDRWALAGDQLYVDLDLSQKNLPAGTLLEIGEAVIKVSEQPHTGCQKFSHRFGLDALRFVNSPVGRELRLRGLNARVVVPGTIRQGDGVRKRPENIWASVIEPSPIEAVS